MRGDFSTCCDICGVPWPRSKLFRDAAGHLRCPDDRDGRDIVTLSNLNATRTRHPASPVGDAGSPAFTMQGRDYRGTAPPTEVPIDLPEPDPE